jgi:hypothetical protein
LFVCFQSASRKEQGVLLKYGATMYAAENSDHWKVLASKLGWGAESRPDYMKVGVVVVRVSCCVRFVSFSLLFW